MKFYWFHPRASQASSITHSNQNLMCWRDVTSQSPEMGQLRHFLGDQILGTILNVNIQLMRLSAAGTSLAHAHRVFPDARRPPIALPVSGASIYMSGPDGATSRWQLFLPSAPILRHSNKPPELL